MLFKGTFSGVSAILTVACQAGVQNPRPDDGALLNHLGYELAVVDPELPNFVDIVVQSDGSLTHGGRSVTRSYAIRLKKEIITNAPIHSIFLKCDGCTEDSFIKAAKTIRTYFDCGVEIRCFWNGDEKFSGNGLGGQKKFLG